MSVLGAGPLVHDWLTAAAAEHDAGVAIASPSRHVTFGELGAYAAALAGALTHRGVGAGNRVVCALDGVEGAVAFFAVLRCGAVVVPSAPEELGALLVETQAKALIVDAAHAASFVEAAARAPGLATIVVHGAFDASRAAGVATYVAYETALMEHDEAHPVRGIDLDPALRLRAVPAGVPHATLLARAATLARGLELRPGDVLAPASDEDRTALLAALGAGACFFLGPAADAADTLAAAPDGARLHVVASLDDEIAEAPGATLHRLYATPACGPVAALAPGAAGASLVVLPNVQVRVLGEGGAVLDASVVGDVAVRGAGVLPGSAGAGGLVLTGDQGMVDAEGRLHLL